MVGASDERMCVLSDLSVIEQGDAKHPKINCLIRAKLSINSIDWRRSSENTVLNMFFSETWKLPSTTCECVTCWVGGVAICHSSPLVCTWLVGTLWLWVWPHWGSLPGSQKGGNMLTRQQLRWHCERDGINAWDVSNPSGKGSSMWLLTQTGAYAN